VKDDLTVPPWQTTDSRLVYTHPRLRLFEDQVIRRDGRRAERHRLTESDSTRVVAVDVDGSLALIWRWRYALGYPVMELPSAQVEAEEEPLRAAQRALRDDCGLAAQLWVKIGQVTGTTDVAAQTTHLYRAKGLHRVPQPAGDGERLAFSMPYGIAVASAVAGAIDDAVSAAALLRAEQHRLSGAWALPEAGRSGPPRLFSV